MLITGREFRLPVFLYSGKLYVLCRRFLCAAKKRAGTDGCPVSYFLTNLLTNKYGQGKIKLLKNYYV